MLAWKIVSMKTLSEEHSSKTVITIINDMVIPKEDALFKEHQARSKCSVCIGLVYFQSLVGL